MREYQASQAKDMFRNFLEKKKRDEERFGKQLRKGGAKSTTLNNQFARKRASEAETGTHDPLRVKAGDGLTDEMQVIENILAENIETKVLRGDEESAKGGSDSSEQDSDSDAIIFGRPSTTTKKKTK